MDADEPAGGRPGPVYRRDLGHADVGARVVVRRRLAGDGLGDVLGELLEWTDVVRVRDRHGDVHAFPVGDVVAGKRVPPPPERR